MSKKFNFMFVITLMVSMSLLLPTIASAKDFSGDWFMNANGWTFNLHLRQKGSSITGIMRAINSNNPDSMVVGEVYGNKIVFFRKNPELKTSQEYEGFLFSKDDGQSMAGEFSHNNKWKYGWYAIRKQKQH